MFATTTQRDGNQASYSYSGSPVSTPVTSGDAFPTLNTTRSITSGLVPHAAAQRCARSRYSSYCEVVKLTSGQLRPHKRLSATATYRSRISGRRSLAADP